MSDNKKMTRPQDSSRINLNQEYEVNWWCNEFACTRDQLARCVERVGVMANDVRACLGK